VQFTDRAGRTHYGWARLTVRGNPNSKIFATLTGYAYETVPNTNQSSRAGRKGQTIRPKTRTLLTQAIPVPVLP